MNWLRFSMTIGQVFCFKLKHSTRSMCGSAGLIKSPSLTSRRSQANSRPPWRLVGKLCDLQGEAASGLKSLLRQADELSVHLEYLFKKAGFRGGARLGFIWLGLLPLVFYSNCSQVPETTSAVSQVSTTCSAPPGVSNSPGTIAETVKLINSLPKPVTIACFVQSLSRPLAVYASMSASSAQPAVGPGNPRMFIFSKQLILTIAPAGFGGDLLEMGQLTSNAESIKGELKFPIYSQIPTHLPFSRIDEGGSTTCVFCHQPEYRASGYTNAFVSRAIRASSFSRVSLNDLKLQALACDALAEPYRCGILRSVFDHGEVVDQDFPAGMPGN